MLIFFFLPYLNFSSFDFCQDCEKRNPSENLGQVLFGDRITSSPYKVIQRILFTIILNGIFLKLATYSKESVLKGGWAKGKEIGCGVARRMHEYVLLELSVVGSSLKHKVFAFQILFLLCKEKKVYFIVPAYFG